MSAATVAPSPADYAPAVDGIAFAELGAAVSGDLEPGAWLGALRSVADMQRRSSWWLGDLLAYGEGRDMSYAEAAEATGLAVGSLRNMASVSLRVAPDDRRAGVAWRTHKVVAALEPDQQRWWLDFARTEGLTSDEVERRLRAGSGGESGPPADPLAGAAVCPRCNGSGAIEEVS